MASPTSTLSSRDRLLQAASVVFSREGFQGATTRAIAKEAGVNEVTLFRLFENKERLLAEVLSEARKSQSDLLCGSTAWTGDLQADLKAHAQAYNALLEANEAMIRTMIGEAQRHPAMAQQVIQEAVRPARDGFIAYLKAAQKAGRVRKEVKLPAAADMFTGMILAGMLRRTAHGITDYSTKQYLETCLSIFVAGITPAADSPPKKGGKTKP